MNLRTREEKLQLHYSKKLADIFDEVLDIACKSTSSEVYLFGKRFREYQDVTKLILESHRRVAMRDWLLIQQLNAELDEISPEDPQHKAKRKRAAK